MQNLPTIKNKEARFIATHCKPLTMNSKFAQNLEDDVAFLRSNKKILVKSDSIYEGIHCKIGTDPLKIGHKLLARNISDIAAKGGTPIAFTLSIFKSKKTDEAFLITFLKGFESFKIPLIGGDIANSLSEFFSASVTIFAEKSGKIPSREKAKVGDFIYVTGQIGRAFLGFSGKKEFLSFYETPNPPVKLMQNLFSKYKINASIDVSDGFLKDLSTLLSTSKVGCEIDFTKIPFPKNQNDFKNMLTFGDDYEVIFTSKDEIFEKNVIKIGIITKQENVQILNSPKIEFENFGYSVF